MGFLADSVGGLIRRGLGLPDLGVVVVDSVVVDSVVPVSADLSSSLLRRVVVNGVRYIICIRVDFVLILWLFVYWG